jgi:hypothetical protein
MAKVKTVTLTFDESDLTDIVEFRVFYDVNAINDKSPYISVPVVAGQTAYEIELPTAVPVTDGSWTLGVIAVDDAGNESDMDTITRFFDFIPPAKPVWRN